MSPVRGFFINGPLSMEAQLPQSGSEQRMILKCWRRPGCQCRLRTKTPLGFGINWLKAFGITIAE
jgi:hypothetical protein